MLNSLKKLFRNRTSGPVNRSVRLNVERLDERIVPSTWTQISNTPNGDAPGTMFLMPDGTIMAQDGANQTTSTWFKYAPGANGSYVTGTWSSLPSMNVARQFYGSVVLPNDNVFVVGGEYSSNGGFDGTSETYNMTTKTWTMSTPFPLGSFGDDPLTVLNTGKVLAGYFGGPQTYLYNPASNTWAATGTKLRNDQSDEESFVLLPDHSVLTYDIFDGLNHAQRYVPSTGTWVDAGIVPAALSNLGGLGAELGPALLLPDGRAFYVGANNLTAIYTPSTNTWAAGPTLPAADAAFGADDAPGAILPNGDVLFVGDNSGSAIFTPPTKMFEFDPVANTITDITATLPAQLQTDMGGNASYVGRMLVLPTGQMLYSDGFGSTYVYTPDGGPSLNWRPVVQSITSTGPGTYHVTGLRLDGISQGNSYGDDVQQAENYPIVSITNASTGAVIYARTSNWAPGIVSSPGSVASMGADFKLPSGTPAGTYTLVLSAAGIQSIPVVLRVASAVPGGFSPSLVHASTGTGSTSTGIALPPTSAGNGTGVSLPPVAATLPTVGASLGNDSSHGVSTGKTEQLPTKPAQPQSSTSHPKTEPSPSTKAKDLTSIDLLPPI